MSLRTAQWAMYESGVEDALAHRLLGIMVDVMDGDGKKFFRSQSWLAEQAHCSVATVKRKLSELESLGVIERGDQSILDRMSWPRDRRPVVWDAVIGAVAQYEPPSTGSSNRARTVAQTEYERQLTGELQNSPYPPHTLPITREGYTEDFEAFWKQYPNKTGKAGAWKHYQRLVKAGTEPEAILQAAVAYSEQIKREGTDPRYVMRAYNWFGKDVWEAFASSPADRVEEYVQQLVDDGAFNELARLAGVAYLLPPDIAEMPPGHQRSDELAIFRAEWLEMNLGAVRKSVKTLLA